MPTDGEIDYRTLTDAQLVDASSRIDASAYPRNHANLRAELARRGVQVARPPGAARTAGLVNGGDGPMVPRLTPPTAVERLLGGPLARAAFRGTIGVLAILSFAAFLDDLVWTEAASRLAEAAALAGAVLGYGVGLLRYGPLIDVADPAFIERANRHPSLHRRGLRALVASVLGACLGFGAASGTAWAWTAVEGRTEVRTYVVERWYGGDLSWRCPRVRLEGVPRSERRGFCHLRPRPPGTRLRIEGAATRFGIRAEHVVVLP